MAEDFSCHVHVEVAMTHDILITCHLFCHRSEVVEQNTRANTVSLKNM